MGQPSTLRKPIKATEPVLHLGYLDSLRGLAILGVLAVHVVAINDQASWIVRPLGSGSIGVELFYMVSAFTLFLSLDGRTGEHRPTVNFFVRRFFRIAPMFYLSVVLNMMRLRLAFVHGRRPSGFEYLLAFLFLFGFKASTVNTIVVGGWSVAVETTFYAMLPLLHRWIQSLRSALIAFSAALLAFVPLSLYLAQLHRNDPEKFIFYALAWFPIQLPVFLLGIVLYFAWKIWLPNLSLGSKLVSAALMLIIALGALLTPLESVWYLPPALLVAGGFFLALVIYPWKLFVNPITRYMGKISYSFYLLHFFVLETLPKAWTALSHRSDTFLGLPLHHLPSLIAMYLVILGVSVMVCTASFRWIEQPCIKLGRKLIAHLEHRAATRTAMPSLLSPLDTPDSQV